MNVGQNAIHMGGIGAGIRSANRIIYIYIYTSVLLCIYMHKSKVDLMLNGML